MKQEQIIDHEKQSTSSLSLNRRQFLKQMGIWGGGIIVYFSVGDLDAWARMKREGFLSAKIPTDYNAFLKIGTDGRVTCLTGKIEMGQGPITSLPQMLAEELDIAYDSINLIMGDTNLCPWDVGTFGSLSTRHFGIVLREAASEAKGVLKELASETLKCPIESLETKNGVVYDKTRPGHKVTYAKLAKGKTIERHLKDAPPLKQPAEYSIMGKSFLRVDSREKVTGKAKYAGDIRLPGMLYASIVRPPAHGAKLKNIDVSKAKEMKDVLVVKDGDLTAVLHKYPDMADMALSKIKTEYDLPKTGVDHETIFKHLLAVAPKGTIPSDIGNLETGKKMAKDIVEKTYLNSYVAHAPMETHTAVASFEKGKCTVWASTQTPFSTRDRIAGVLGLEPDKVRIITPFVGGGFGGKGAPGDQAVEAARLAKLTGKPVQVAWSREEEFFYDTFRPAAVVKIISGTDENGKIVYWDYNVFFAGERGSELFYDIAHHRTTVRGEWMQNSGAHPFAVGPWRAPGNNTNTYAREFHINLMAAKAGIDPLEFRLKNLKDKRMIRVLKAAAQKFGWRASKSPSGRGVGISCAIDAGTYVAHMAEVNVDKSTGAIQAKRVVCAQDMGVVVNPEGAKIQMEGCITMGLGYALTEEIHFKDGKISDLNFDSYELPRFSWLPEIETVLVDNVDLPPQGGGEPAIVGMGAVLASAVFDATGANLFQLPMTPDRVKKALEV
ncbi:MAG: molybdopterin cofactor-binding domain-containing protein [Pseudomonadota bacterium]